MVLRRDALLAFCRSLPHATSDVKWGNDLVFSVGQKMFATFVNDGGDARFGCKVPEEDFDALTSIDGIRPAPYAARYHWIAVDDPAALPEREALALIRGSYELVKAKLPARTRREIDQVSGLAEKKKPRAMAAPAAKKRRLPKAVAAKTSQPVRAKR
jgi:predicted DNA-binding protein (MmcQ/YjbR family)